MKPFTKDIENLVDEISADYPDQQQKNKKLAEVGVALTRLTQLLHPDQQDGKDGQ